MTRLYVVRVDTYVFSKVGFYRSSHREFYRFKWWAKLNCGIQPFPAGSVQAHRTYIGPADTINKGD
ncbi:MAG: hypothetical protein RI567_14005 [Marinobacter sp.]|nr:hypothetical protein [Marinobacter sp.]